MNKVWIVYATSGSYSDYSLDNVYIGPTDPKPLLDAHAASKSNGLWKTWEEASRGANWTPGLTTVAIRERESARKSVMESAVGMLETAGFAKTDATEVWLDD